MKKFLLVILCGLMFTCVAHGESDFYRQWYDYWYSIGDESGKEAKKYDPDTSYKKYETENIQPKYDELQAVVEYKKAEEYLKASKEGFYAGYRSGYYREKEKEIVATIEEKSKEDVRIYNFKFGKMRSGEDFVVTEEIRDVKVPTTEGEKNYFGYTFDYTDNRASDNLVVVITLPGKPKKDLGPNFYPSTNSVISQHVIPLGSGHFGNKWYFSKGDLTGKFRLAVYIGNKLIQRIWFEASE
ncbi:MAG: hypothetical protein ABID83_02820 [Candidatus Omnitrophota bacterium]